MLVLQHSLLRLVSRCWQSAGLTVADAGEGVEVTLVLPDTAAVEFKRPLIFRHQYTSGLVGCCHERILAFWGHALLLHLLPLRLLLLHLLL